MARLTKEYLSLIEGSGVSGNIQGAKKSVSSSIEGSTNVPQENQTAVVYDIISEGPIEGLVDGTNSIFLDKTPVTIGDTKHQPIKIKNATFTASNSTLVDSDSSNPFANLSIADGKRFIRIPKGKKSITGNGSSTGVSGSEGSTILTASSSFFEPQDVSDINPLTGTDTPIDTDTPKPFIRIEGAGTNSNVPMVAPIIRFISATSVEIGHPLPRDISYKTASIDKIGTISSFTDTNTAVIADLGAVGTAKIDASNVEVEVFTPSIGREDTVYNYQGFQYAFMHGQRNQPYLKGFKDIGSAAIIENKNQAVEQTRDLFSSNDNTTTGAWNTTVADATAQPVIVTDSAVANPEEVDNVKLTFKFPQMIASKSNSGDEKPANCELRIWLGFKKTGDSAFTEKLMFGATQSELDSRSANKKTRPWESAHNSGKIRTLTKAPFAESFVIDLTPFKPFSEYQIKIQRVDPSQGRHRDYDHISPCTLDTVEHRFTDKLAYPNSAFATMLFDAESFSKIPSRSYEVKGLKVKVPTNYFPKGEEGRAYGEYDRNPSSGADSGSYQNWDGNFRGDISTFTKGHINHELVWTDNPAWVFYDLVTNKRYGVGKYIDEAQIDKFELYKIARYCDELVADGKGGTEPRFTANVYIKESADALKVLKDITQIFRGMLYWLDGQIQFSQNRYQLPVYTFSKGNVTGGFSYTSPRGEFRSNQVRVTWNDPESMYKQAVEIVEDTNNILETGKVVPKDIVAFGATSRGQAHRFGKWALFTEILESEAVAFQSSINAGFLKPGDVILIQDADKDVISNSGRLSTSSSTTGINLDRNVNLSSGNTFKLSIMYPQGGAYLSSISATINDNTGDAAVTNNYQRGDLVTHAKVNGTVVEITTDTQARNAVDSSGNGLDLEWNPNSRVETQTISTTGSSVSTLTTGAFTSAPNAEMMWAIREYDAAGDIVNGSAQQYVISEIKEDANKLYTISALKYDPSKFDLVDRGYILDVGVDTNKLPSFTETPPAPETLTLDVLKSFGSGLNDESNISGTTNKIRINWGRVLNSDGTQYQHLSHFEIKHNINSLKGNKFKKLTVPKDENYLSVDFDGPKTMIVQIQSVNINGGKSQIVQRKLEVTNDQIVNSGTQILKIPNDGKINKHIQCSTSTVSIDSKNYQLQSSDGTIYTNPSNANAASYQQSFSGMANNSEAYLLFDASESATSGDILKAVEIKKDSTAQIPTGASTSIPLDFEYMAEVGASSSGITQLTANSQTISGSVGDNIITGSSTAFTTDFVNGDIIVIAPAGATRFYSKISYIENDGKLQIVDGLPRDYSSVAVSKLSFKPDPVSDVILAKVSYDGSTYTLEEKYTEGTESLGYFHHENTSNTNALSVDAFKTQFGRFPQEGDILIVVNTAASPKASKSYKFSNNAFSEIANFMTGDLLVDGTIEGDKIRSDTQIIAGADDSNKQAVLDGTGTGDDALRIYAGANVANKANAPFKVTQAGALTATSATIGGAIDATTLNVVNASVVGSLTASELTAGSVTVQSLNQAVWNEIDTRVAGASANGFYDNKNSTTGYLGVSKTLSLTGSSSAGYQHNGEALHLRFQLVDSFGPTPAGFTGDGLKVTAQFQYRLASSSTWINVGSSLTQSLTRTDYSSGALYDIDMDHDVEISSSLTTSSYYHFQVVLTPTITNNAFVAFITYNSGGANDSSGSPFHFAAQQGSTSVGSGSGTVTSVGSGDGLTGGAITGSGTLAVDSTVVRTSGTQTIAGDKTFSNDIIVTGNLDVRGTTTTLDTATLNVEDKNITLNYGSGSTVSTADGAGITIQDAVDASTDATILWNATNDRFDFSHAIDITGSATVDGLTVDGNTASQTYRSSRTDGDVYIQAQTNSDFVKIGTQTKINALLVDGSGDISFYEDTGTTAKLFWDASAESLGIGTTSPSEKLDVRDGTITSRDSTNTNYAELDRFTGLTLKGNGAGSRYVKTPNADNLVLGTNNLDRVTILGSGADGLGYVGINRTDPVYNLDVRGKTRLNARASDNDDPTLYILDNSDDVADRNYESIHLDYNLSGNDALTADRSHRGLFMDIDSTASGGDTNEEHRIYGIDVDLDFGGDSDLVIGGNFHVENNNSSGTNVTNIHGVRGFAVNDTSGTARSVNAHGGYFQAQLKHSSTQTADINVTGCRGRVFLDADADGAGINDLTGIYADIEIDDPGQATSADNAYVGRFIFNNDDTTNNNVSFNNAFLVHGTYQGGEPATGSSWGLYMSATATQNYIGGRLAIGTSSSTHKLQVHQDSTETDKSVGHFYTSYAHSGTGNNSLVSILSDDAGASGTTLNVRNDGTGILFNVEKGSDVEFRIQNDGKVGIGTDTPGTILEIADSLPKLRITDTRNQSFTVGDIMSSIEFDSDDSSGGAGTSAEPRAAINMYADSTFGSSTGLAFYTKGDNANYPTKQMIITSEGKVAIGTDSIQSKLTVEGDAFLSGDNRHLYFGGNNTFIGENSNSTKLQLRGGGNATTSTVFIDTGGAIGVGTSTPSGRIHSVGSGGTQVIKVEATDGNQASFDLMNSEGHYRIVTDSGQFRVYDQTDTRQPLTINTDGQTTLGSDDATYDLKLESDAPILLISDTSASTEHKLVSNNSELRIYGDDVVSLNTNNLRRLNVADNGDIGFYEDTGTTTKFFWDASTERLGIGTDTPDTGLDIETTSGIRIKQNDQIDNPPGNSQNFYQGIAFINQSANTQAYSMGYGFGGQFTLNYYDGNTTYSRIMSVSNTGNLEVEGSVATGSFVLPDVAGTVGQLLKWPSSGTTLEWADDTGTTINNNANNRIITGSSTANTLEAESTLTWDGSTLNVGGNIQIPSKIIHDSDVDTYLHFANIDDFRIVTGNSTRAAFNNSKIHFNQEGINQDFHVEGDNVTDLLYVDASTDRVGVGTSTPGQKLHISGGVSRFQGTTSNWLEIDSTSGSGNDVTLSTRFNTLRFDVPSANDAAYDFRISNVSKMFMDGSGNVGIGTNDPDTLLHLKTATTDAITTLLKLHGPFVDNDGTEGTAIDFGTASDSSVGARIIGSREEAGARGALRFCTGRESDTGFNDGRMVIDPSGDVGIGTTSPDALLDLEGSFEGNSNFALKFTNTMGTGAVGGFRSHGLNGEHLTMYQEGARKQSWGETEVLFYGASDAEIVRFNNDGSVKVTGVTLVSDDGADDFVKQSVSGTTSTLSFGNTESTGGIAKWQYNRSTGSFSGFVGNAAATEFMTIDSTGNVGIPTNKELRFYELSGSEYTGIKSRSSIATGDSITYQLPPSAPANSGAVLICTTAGEMTWSSNTISTYQDGDYDRVIVGAGTSGAIAQFGLTYNKSSGLVIENMATANPGTAVGKLTIGQSTNGSGTSEIIMDSATQGIIRFKDGSTTEASIGISPNVNNGPLDINAGNGVRLQDIYGVDTTTTTTSSTTATVIHTFPTGTFRSARITIQVKNSTDSTYHTTELLTVHDGTNVKFVEYGSIFTGAAEATFDMSIVSGDVRLVATPATTDNMTFKVVCHSITI